MILKHIFSNLLNRRKPANFEIFQQVEYELAAGDNLAAKNLLKAHIREHVKDVDAWLKLSGIYSRTLGQRHALRCLKDAIDLNPNDFRLHAQMSEIYGEARSYKKAIEHAKKANDLYPNETSFIILIKLYLESSNLDYAEETMQKLLATTEPLSIDSQLTEIYILTLRGKTGSALKKLACIDADSLKDTETLSMLAQIYLILKDFDNADKVNLQLTKYSPKNSNFLLLSAFTAREKGDLDRAIEFCRESISTSPGKHQAHVELACNLMMRGNFKEGHTHFLHRYETSESPIRVTRAVDYFNFQSNDHLLLYAEQGIGDEILYASYFQDVLTQVSKCTIVCDSRLEPLFSRSFPKANIEGEANRTNLDALAKKLAVTAHMPFATAAGIVSQDINKKRQARYLSSNSAKDQFWREKLRKKNDMPNIGISWRGGIINTGTMQRSLSISDFSTLTEKLDANFVSLQYGDYVQDIENFNRTFANTITHFPAIDTDYDSLASLIMNLDIVVTVCTAIVHLCGALGKECWVLVPTSPNWRYQEHGNSMPWYKSVRLFRQPKDKPLRGLLDEISFLLEEKFSSKRSLS